MTDRLQLLLKPWIKGEPLSYQCSLCSQTFIPPEDRSPKEGMVEVQAAFNEHIHEEHADGDKMAAL
jgi:hypothetical protein